MAFRKLITAGLLAAFFTGGIAPAFAHDWEHYEPRHEWRERRWHEVRRERAWEEHAWRERHGYYRGPVVVTPGYGYYTAPGYYR